MEGLCNFEHFLALKWSRGPDSDFDVEHEQLGPVHGFLHQRLQSPPQKSDAAKGADGGPVSRSNDPFKMRILCRAGLETMLFPTPRRTMAGMIDV